MYNVIINVNDKKKSYDLIGVDRGTYCWAVLKCFFYKLLKKLHFEYLMKFTDVLYETILA